MHIVLTGGTGLIGRALTKEMIEAGYQVVVLSRNPSRGSKIHQGATLVKWDGRTGEGWLEHADGATAIVNLAGESLAGKSLLAMRWTPERKHDIIESRVQAGAAVLDAVRQVDRKPGVIIQASAVGYYGSRGDERITEQATAGKDFMTDTCLNWEASTAEIDDLGVRRVVIRLGIVLSNSGGALPRQMLPFRFFVGGPIGNGKQGYPWIHITDVSRSIRFLIETKDTTGIYNLCSPQPLSNAEFGRAITKVLHRPFWIPIPGFVFKVAFGEASAVLLEGQFAYPQRLLEAGYGFQYPEIIGALANLE